MISPNGFQIPDSGFPKRNPRPGSLGYDSPGPDATEGRLKKPMKSVPAREEGPWRGRVSARRWTATDTIDDYLAAVPPGARAALAKVRKAIKAAVPNSTEGISYQVPMFKLDGRPLVSFGAGAAHCAFYVMSPAVMRAHAAELRNYEVGKGSIRFPADKPLSAALVTKLVKARIAEVEKGR